MKIFHPKVNRERKRICNNDREKKMKTILDFRLMLKIRSFQFTPFWEPNGTDVIINTGNLSNSRSDETTQNVLLWFSW